MGHDTYLIRNKFIEMVFYLLLEKLEHTKSCHQLRRKAAFKLRANDREHKAHDDSTIEKQYLHFKRGDLSSVDSLIPLSNEV